MSLLRLRFTRAPQKTIVKLNFKRCQDGGAPDVVLALTRERHFCFSSFTSLVWPRGAPGVAKLSVIGFPLVRRKFGIKRKLAFILPLRPFPSGGVIVEKVLTGVGDDQ